MTKKGLAVRKRKTSEQSFSFLFHKLCRDVPPKTLPPKCHEWCRSGCVVSSSSAGPSSPSPSLYCFWWAPAIERRPSMRATTPGASVPRCLGASSVLGVAPVPRWTVARSFGSNRVFHHTGIDPSPRQSWDAQGKKLLRRHTN